MLYSVVCIIFLFAHPLIRKKAYRFFWLSHQLYVLFYILCMLHGLGRITAAPKFWIFFAFPGVVFICDKVKSVFDIEGKSVLGMFDPLPPVRIWD